MKYFLISCLIIAYVLTVFILYCRYKNMLLEHEEKEERKEIVVIKDKGEKHIGRVVTLKKNKLCLDDKIFTLSNNVKWYTYYPKSSLTIKHKMI